MAEWTSPPLPARWGATNRSTFVGRARELAALADAWDLAVRGARQVVFVGGDAGVGKSRIVAEIATDLHRQQAGVLVGTCASSMGAPYQPFVEPIASLLSAVVSGQLTIDAAGESLDGQLERIRTIAGAHRSAEPLPERQYTPQLFRASTDAFLAAARVRPLVLVLEDLHWAGETALQFLKFLVAQTAEARILVLATQRTTPPDRSADMVSTVAQLYRLDGVRRLDLEGLTTEEITDYLAREANVAARRARGPAAMLRDQTGGNPFLLREVWRELAARGGLTALADVDLRAPESVLETVRHRLSGLPPTHRSTVETAAVIGEEFSVAVLTATARQSRPDTDAAASVYAGLEAATAVGLLEAARGSDGVFRFPHGLARQAVLDLMTEYQRACENLSVAGVLEEHFPAVDLRVQRLAHHYANAQALGQADKAVYYLSLAGEAAEDGLAHHEAARLFERAATVAGEASLRDELRLKAARSYMRASRLARARELNELVAITATGTTLLRAAIGFETASWRSGQPGQRSIEMLTKALAGVDLDPLHPLAIKGIAALGRAHAFSGSERSVALGARAVELARRSGDDKLLAAALQTGMHDDGLTPTNIEDKLARATELSRLSAQVGDLRHLGPASYYRAAIAYIRGDPVGLADAHEDMARTARATGQPFWAWVESCLTFGRHFLRADFAAAQRVLAEAEEIGRAFGPNRETDGPVGLQTFMIRRETGRLDQVRGLVSGEEDPGTVWAPGLLALYCELGLREPARRTLHFLMNRDLGRLQISSTWPAVMSFLCDAAVWLDDVDVAQQLHPLAAEYAGLNLMGGEFLAVMGSADRQLGSLESLLEIDTARDRFAAALEMDARMESPLHIASTLTATVTHLRRAGESSSRAAELAERAKALCAQHSLVRVRRQLDAADQMPQSMSTRTLETAARRLTQPSGLTAREAEVLCLLGSGLSNRRIARVLVISENTAANHVRNILMKTGAANRTQAAMYAAAHGLLDAAPTSGGPISGGAGESTPHRVQ